MLVLQLLCQIKQEDYLNKIKLNWSVDVGDKYVLKVWKNR